MKTIALDRCPGQLVAEPLSFDLIADSALVMPGRPVFVPDFSSSWSARLYVAARISRLGKSIRPRFSSRYYDAVTLALRLVPDDVDRALVETGAWRGVCGLFDGCLAVGRWLAVPSSETEITVSCGDRAWTLTAGDMALDEVLSRVSSMSMLKMGDIIMPCFMPDVLPVQIDGRITAGIGGDVCLDVKLK